MTQIMDNINRRMQEDAEREMQADRQKTSIAFYDLNEMSSLASLGYVAGIIGVFSIILYVLIQKVVSPPVDFTKQKRMERMAKRESGSAKKNK